MTLSMPSPGICPAVVLAGGLGTRLRAVFDGPKAMAPVAGRPFLEHVLGNLRAQQVRNVILCVGYRRTRIRRYFGTGRKLGLRIAYSVETTLLGTAGALKQAGPLVRDERFFVLNGDSILVVDLAAMLEFHRGKGAAITIALTRTPDAARYGAVDLQPDGAMRAFLEKSAQRDHHREGIVNGGVYLMERSVLDHIPSGRAVSLEHEVFPHYTGGGLYGFTTAGYFLDIGIPQDLARAQVELPRLEAL